MFIYDFNDIAKTFVCYLSITVRLQLSAPLELKISDYIGEKTKNYTTVGAKLMHYGMHKS